MNNRDDELHEMLSANNADDVDKLAEAAKADMKVKGCSFCATEHPKIYKFCMNIKRRAEKLHKRVPSVCGGETWGRGLNNIPPKKKHKKRK